MPHCEFIFDFASPNAYLARPVIAKIEERTSVKFTITLALLGGIFKETHNKAPMVMFENVPSKLKYIGLEIERFAKKHGLDKYRPNPHFPIHTLNIMRCGLVAQRENQFKTYADIVMQGMWEQGLNMWDNEVLVETLSQGGLDGKAIMQQSQETEIKQQLIKNTQHAVERGVFGIPTFFVGEEIFFGKDSLGLVEEEILNNI